MDQPSADLLAKHFPELKLRRDVHGHETLLSIDAARRVIGYEPAHSWRESVVR